MAENVPASERDSDAPMGSEPTDSLRAAPGAPDEGTARPTGVAPAPGGTEPNGGSPPAQASPRVSDAQRLVLRLQCVEQRLELIVTVSLSSESRILRF